jgi:hypothetical protein
MHAADEMAAVIRQDLDKSLDEAVTVLSESELREKVGGDGGWVGGGGRAPDGCPT